MKERHVPERDTVMAGTTPNPWPQRPASSGPSSTHSVVAMYRREELGPIQSILLSLAVHVGIVLAVIAAIFIAKLLGISLMTLDRPDKLHDVEFQLVDAPKEKPRNPNTRNRAEHDTRAGGEKIPRIHEAQPLTKAGQPQKHPKPQQQAARQQPQQQRLLRPQPQHQQRPSPQHSPVHMTAPPRPQVSAPKPSLSQQRLASLPNVLAPIKVPHSASSMRNTGPVVKGKAGGGPQGASGSASSSGSPAMMPGQFTHGHPGTSGGGGSPGGQRGRSNTSQAGSPGGGGGRAGIDAVGEPDFGPYIAELQRRIRRNWTPPDDRSDKTVVVLFTIDREGRLKGITMRRASGFADADAAARRAIENSAPFRPLPENYHGNTVSVEFTFDYNVYMGRSGGIR